jgi:hypothetical protein
MSVSAEHDQIADLKDINDQSKSVVNLKCT